MSITAITSLILAGVVLAGFIIVDALHRRRRQDNNPSDPNTDT